MAQNKIPRQWENCPTYGQIIDDTFLPMKTPLGDDIDLPEEHKFSPRLFFDQMRAKKIDVGLLINLSFSTRYYDGDEIIDDHNIEYKQICCRGFNEAPQPKERAEFVKVCNQFLARNSHKKIAVHCTHGFNRTGFMICFYLCSERDWSVDAAVSLFSSKRPPGIYKQDYLNELFNIFGDADDPVPQAPPRPVWDDLSIATAEDEQTTSSNPLKQKEFYEGISGVTLVRDEALKTRIYTHCCHILDYEVRGFNIKFPGAQPVSMDLNNIQLLATHRYRVSWKADGCRYMLYIKDQENIFFLTRNLDLWRVEGLYFPRINDLQSHLTDTLLDGEMVTDEFRGEKIPRYLIYDVISLDGTIVRAQDFDKRCGKIKCVIVEARRRAKQANLIPREGEPFKIADKGFYMLHDAKKTWDMPVFHEKDGMIFQPVDAPYVGGTCHNILKWKPPELNSIDFRLVVRDEQQNGCLPETYAYLHVCNKKEPLFRFKLDRDQQEYRNYHNKIVEMTLKNQKWTVLRERTDKLSANTWETAASVFRTIKTPITDKYLFDFIAKLPRESRQPPPRR